MGHGKEAQLNLMKNSVDSVSTAHVFPLRWADRSRIVTDWTCPRKRFWQYEFGGRGIVPAVTSLELWLGTTLHDGLARIADSSPARIADATPAVVDIDAIASAAQQQVYTSLAQVPVGEIPDADTLTFAAEQAALVEGLLRGFYRHVWPRLLREGWRIVAVEEESIYTISMTLKFMSRPDLILADPDDNWYYVEYKSTSSKKSQWVDSWTTAVQLHSSVKAVEETLKHEVAGVIVQGLYKGYESYGRQNSPFCYAYVAPGNPPFTTEKVRYDYAAGFKRQPTWERPGGVARWVAEMPEELLSEQFPQVPPIFVKEELVQAFFRQVEEREHVISEAVQAMGNPSEGDPRSADEIMDEVFPQRFDQCQPAWGRGCEYKRLCHGKVAHPLEAGYTWRVPHHVPEAEALQKEAGQ